ncbi:hypothetical protein FB45DRAFT_871981 [Roridomyces roridus]|uniref:Uncharacterized protein n=1 Tax=Roridomyces roridus TaxID=1738132 RepID=A0AAD7FE42_9AGAR|nr:hypothetical protein FB45DRAFT_871981 [Roridomyces roridus]
MFLSLNIAFYLNSTVTVIRASPTKSLLPELMLYRVALALEDRFLDILSLIHHLHDHGRHYLKITLLAIVGHSLGLLLVFAQRCAAPFVSRHRAKFLRYLRNTWVEAITALITGSLYTFHSSFSWVPWMHYYFIYRDGILPSLWNIRREIVICLDWIPLESVLMIIAPVAIHAVAICLCTLSFAHIWFPAAARTIAHDVDRPALGFIAGGSIFLAIGWYCNAVLCFLGMEQKAMGDDVKYWIRSLEMQTFSSSQARAEVWEFYQLSRERHKTWRITQSKEACKIMRLLWITAWSTWEALPWAQKLIVVVPAAAFYVHFYIMPVVERIELLIRIEYRKYRRRRAVRQFHLKNYSVENRLAANN